MTRRFVIAMAAGLALAAPLAAHDEVRVLGKATKVSATSLDGKRVNRSDLNTGAFSAAPAARPTPVHEEYGFVGMLVAVDLPKNRVTLQFKEGGQDQTIRLVLTEKTEVLDKDKKKIARSTLKRGLTAVVRAWGDGDAEEMDALSIRIVPPIAK